MVDSIAAAGGFLNVSRSGDPAVPKVLPLASAAHARSQYLRLRSAVDALVRIAEHAGDTMSFLNEATDTAMELTRATGAVVLMTDPSMALTVAAARGQMACVDGDAFDGGQTLARASLRTHQTLHSDATGDDERIHGATRAERALHSLIATPLRYGDEVLGVLEVCSSVPRAFDDIDAQGVAMIGNALGGALGRQIALDDNACLLARLNTSLQATRAEARKYQDAALYDALTGLPNRAHFLARLEEVCQQYRGQPDGFAVLFLDLDDFKAINDLHGHATGDAVLTAAAAALTVCLREADLVARLGGDEFVVLLTRLRHGGRDTQAIASDLLESLRRPRNFDGIELSIEASVGWTAHDGQRDAAAMMAAADAAMYQHKKSRRPR